MRSLPWLGANLLPDGTCSFVVWAPDCKQVDLVLIGDDRHPVPLDPDDRGYFSVVLEHVRAGDQYFFRLNGEHDRPDPASRFQPKGVHGPSLVVDPNGFDWQDASWDGPPLDEYVIYELHIGTFTEEGTFDGAIARLDELADLGITAIEVMPVAQFPGERNWGYDGVNLFAVQDSYGGPEGFRRLVDACHRKGLAVILDVVYNHLGPEGNYLREFGPYFTDHYQTPWGDALNFDGPGSDHVRHFFLENARHWLREYHVDAFRLDAVHSIYDVSAVHFLEELATTVHREASYGGRRGIVIAESDLNDPKVIRGPELGGWGHDAQWADDFHHALHAVLTGEQDGYYTDFGSARELARVIRDGYRFTGDYSHYRQRRHGRWPGTADGRRFVVCSQNHDQVGNRATGDRLTAALSFDQLKLAAGVTILSSFTPMLFMGEEYAEPNPFQYFVSHGDPDLVTAVQEGRRREFQAFNWEAEVPDPQAESTFHRSKLNHDLKNREPNSAMFGWYRELLRVRRATGALRNFDLTAQEVWNPPGSQVVVNYRRHADGDCLLIVNFSDSPEDVTVHSDHLAWHPLLNSQESRWNGSGHKAAEFALTGSLVRLTLPGSTLFVFEAAGE